MTSYATGSSRPPFNARAVLRTTGGGPVLTMLDVREADSFEENLSFFSNGAPVEGRGARWTSVSSLRHGCYGEPIKGSFEESDSLQFFVSGRRAFALYGRIRSQDADG